MKQVTIPISGSSCPFRRDNFRQAQVVALNGLIVGLLGLADELQVALDVVLASYDATAAWAVVMSGLLIGTAAVTVKVTETQLVT